MIRVKCACGRVMYPGHERCPMCGRSMANASTTLEEVPLRDDVLVDEDDRTADTERDERNPSSSATALANHYAPLDSQMIRELARGGRR